MDLEKVLKINLFLLIIAMLSGCATTVAPFTTNSENTWFLESNHGSGDIRPIYCMANKKDQYASPKCYLAPTYETREDTKESKK